MAKSKRLGVSIFVVILTILMAVSVVMTFAISYIFGNDGVSGKLFGSHIYIMETDDMYSDPAKKTPITKGSAIIAEDEDTFPPGTVILFKNGAREDVMRVREITYDDNNKSTYHVAADLTPEKTYEVKGEDVIAKSVTVSENLGGLISFLSSVPGIIVGMILPCFVILAMLIIKIVSMRKADDEEDEAYDEYEDYDDDDDDNEYEGFNGHKVKALHHSSGSGSPLFNPESDINPTDEFERKKSSIAMNFSQKGAAAKRPARDRREAPKAAVERFREAVDEKPRVPVARKGSLVPEGQEVSSDEKLAAIKAALSGQQTESPRTAPSVRRTESVEKTARFTAIKDDVKPAPARPVAKPAPKAPAKPAARPVAPKPAAKPSDKASNISSIDDLIKILEEEKKKL